MKNSLLKLFAGTLFLILSAISGCKKSEVIIPGNNLADKIAAYLESQKITSGSTSLVNKNANIDLLKRNLDFTSAKNEELDNRLDLLIVPIKDAVITEKNLDNNSLLTLILITDKLGRISSGSIVHFQPSDGKKHTVLPHKTFSNLLGRKELELDGLYKILTVTGRWISQFEVKNGKLFSAGNIEQKDNGKISTQKTSSTTCTDLYLVTTYFWSDGSTSEDWHYLLTTCSDCGDPEYGSLCPDGGGGNGPEDNEDGGDDLSTSRLEVLPASNGDKLNIENLMIGVTYHAWVGWSYNHQVHTFNYIRPGMPYATPASQVFLDDNKQSAILAVTCANSSVAQLRLTVNSVLVQYTFNAIWSYQFAFGPRGPFTFFEGLSKVIGPLFP